ncbi:MAG: PadR family transcriptional regulator [Gemmatimonadetes bacterium]|jgi:PadR family transcriptional regulator PadR|nr:PadR family transcriptional regulator [Gemmatimonadota bacterium]MCC7325113.1 PadR family transcriptional regulator [Gemmatimonadaceae bacterium]MBK6456424.1 PadR family transcriptional regulator [Gemmatimonadota bacterium]MBK6844196.1 PadR family transcriptional regulator [Gemmatimonadota bacterium]MBK7833939.1 PadR family transcriptional regulator [Gemmatimonadota bacterium]
MASDADLLRSTLDLLVLKSLTWGPRHGYGVAEWVHQSTGGHLLIEEGTLYPALHRLEARGWIEPEWGVSENNRRAKFYRLAPKGRSALRAEVSTWERYVAAVARALAQTTPVPA